MSELVAARGYDGTTVEEIVTRAGVSRKTFYERHKSREQWFIEICQTAAGGLSDRITRAGEAGGSRSERAARISTTLLGHWLDDPTSAHACFVETLAAGEQARAWRGQLLETLHTTIAQAIGGERAPDIDRLATRAAVGAVLELVGHDAIQVDEQQAVALIQTILVTGEPPR